MFDVLFVDARIILDNGKSQRIPLDKKNEPILIFHLVINVFRDFGYDFCFEKKSKFLHTFALFSFLSTCYLVSLKNGQKQHYRGLKKAQTKVF